MRASRRSTPKRAYLSAQSRTLQNKLRQLEDIIEAAAAPMGEIKLIVRKIECVDLGPDLRQTGFWIIVLRGFEGVQEVVGVRSSILLSVISLC